MENSKLDREDTKRNVGTGAGALVGAAAGAAVGTVIPGVGNVVGALIGGAVGLAGGAIAGRAIADSIDPKVEGDYWRSNHTTRPYAGGQSYDDLEPAYRHGWESRAKYPLNKRFEDVESEMGGTWTEAKGGSKLAWDKAKHASRDAWDRVERAIPGDSDGDGK